MNAKPKEREQNRDAYTGQFAFTGGFERMCVCGHTLASHGLGGIDCLVGTGIPQYNGDDNSKQCECQKFRLSRRKSKSRKE